jgi:hypothetical protein
MRRSVRNFAICDGSFDDRVANLLTGRRFRHMGRLY